MYCWFYLRLADLDIMWICKHVAVNVIGGTNSGKTAMFRRDPLR